MSIFISTLFLAAIALTVLAYIQRNNLPLWGAAMFSGVLAIRVGEAQLLTLVQGIWSSWWGA